MKIRFAVVAFVLSWPLVSIGQTNARGAGISLPVVGRVVGGGNTLFRTSVDVANNTDSALQVDFYFDALDPLSQQPLAVKGSITNSGIVEQGAGTLRAHSVAQFSDFIETLVAAGRMSAATRDAGVLGSLLLVYNGHTRSGQGSASARFYNDFGGGTVGVSLNGHEITNNEPVALTAVVRDTRGKPGPQLYSNLFINNTGLAPLTGLAAEDVTVEVSALASSNSQPIGTPMILTIPKGQTRSINQVLTALGVASSVEETILVTVRVTAGGAAIAGIVSTVDAVTRDGSVVEMTRADF